MSSNRTRCIEREPAVILAFEAVRTTGRVSLQDLYHLTEQINNYGVETPVTTKDVESMLVRFMMDSELYDKCLKAAKGIKN